MQASESVPHPTAAETPQLIARKVYIYESCEAYRNTLINICKQELMEPYIVSEDEFVDFIANPLEEFKEMYLLILGPTEDTIGINTTDVVNRLRDSRPSTPKIVRLADKAQCVLAGQENTKELSFYCHDDIEQLGKTLSSLSKFSVPDQLVDEVNRMAVESIEATFSGIKVSLQKPYIVLDDLARGDLVGIANIQSKWCDGNILVECNGNDMNDLIIQNKTVMKPFGNNFDAAQEIISELTNLVLGKIRNRLFDQEDYNAKSQVITIPLIINHNKRLIQFSSLAPQICFRFILSDVEKLFSPCVLGLKLIFNIRFDEQLCETSIKNALDNKPDTPDQGTVELL